MSVYSRWGVPLRGSVNADWLMSFLGLPAGTDILRGGISPAQRSDSATGIFLS